MRCKKHLLRGNISRKTEYIINPQMTRNELVPPNKTKSTSNDMHRKRFLKVVTSKPVFAWPLVQITFKKSLTFYLE